MIFRPFHPDFGCYPVYRADSSRGDVFFLENEPVEVIGEIGEGEFGFGSQQADHADEQAETGLLMGEDVFDLGPDGGFGGIGLGGRARHRLPSGLPAMNVAGQHPVGEPGFVSLGAIGGIGPNGAAGILAVNEMRQHAAIGVGG